MHSQKKRRMNSYHSTRNLEYFILIIILGFRILAGNRISEDLGNKNLGNWMFQENVQFDVTRTTVISNNKTNEI
ncbi:hypothetical protein RhiirA4_489684 [Rhizophagus irregularis]|uniref:Uncharacterized protein n=1 Tax=Rhizophagus irregularis TaxID=588596 RepID=A0A2I1HV08_9GLOM|nr:hypothetical protein RhiirA4_489684 [Rhizophagus irregularis]